MHIVSAKERQLTHFVGGVESRVEWLLENFKINCSELFYHTYCLKTSENFACKLMKFVNSFLKLATLEMFSLFFSKLNWRETEDNSSFVFALDQVKTNFAHLEAKTFYKKPNYNILEVKGRISQVE